MKKLLLILLLVSSVVFAEEKVTIEADEVSTPEDSVYHAKGNVKIFQGDKTMLADEVFYNKEKNILRAINNVQLSDGENTFQCEEMYFNTETQSGTFTNAKAFMPPYHWITASKLDRHNKYSYGMDDATFTTCSGDNPDWSFGAKQADLNIGGYLTAFHTTARIKDVPVLYSPFMVYPVKLERESGFLIPDAGYSSGTGVYVVPKFFWNIDVDQDATFSTVLSTNKDPLYGMEYRYRISRNSTIDNYIEYTTENKEYPDSVHGASGIKEQPSRYFIYNTSSLQITDNFSIKTQVDMVSDYEYIDDYDKFSLLKDYDNDTDEYVVNLTANYATSFADFSVKYLDQMDYTVGRRYLKEHTYYKPRISVSKNISSLPIYFNYYAGYDDVRNTRYIHSYLNGRTVARDFAFKREHVFMNFYKPVDLYIGTFTPALKVYQTKWHNLTSNIALPEEQHVSSFAKLEVGDNSFTRTIYRQTHTFKLNEIYRYYGATKHSIYNTIKYVQTPNLYQEEIRETIYSDHIDPNREYIYSLSNVLRNKDYIVKLKNSVKHSLMEDNYKSDYFITEASLQTAPLQLGTKYEYNTDDQIDEYLSGYVQVNLNDFYLRASYIYDQDDYGTEDNNTVASLETTYTTKKYDLSYTREISGMNETPTTANLTDTEDTFKLTYKKECWNFTISYVRETSPSTVDYSKRDKTEHSVMFTVSLKGLGEDDSKFRAIDTEDENDEI